MNDRDKDEVEKRKGNNLVEHNSSSLPLDWKCLGINFVDASAGLIAGDDQIPVCSSASFSASLVDSLRQNLWEPQGSAQIMELSGISMQRNGNIPNAVPTMNQSSVSLSSRIQGVYPPSMLERAPNGLPQFPADLGLIGRAVRFSCFDGVNMGVGMSSLTEPIGVCPTDGRMGHEPHDMVPSENGRTAISHAYCQKKEPNFHENAKDGSSALGHRAAERSPIKSDERSASNARSHEEAKDAVNGSGDASAGSDFSNCNGQEDAGGGGEPPDKGLSTKKRKRNGQDAEPSSFGGGIQKPNALERDWGEPEPKVAQNTDSNAKKTAMTKRKQGSEPAGPSKGYVHVRARRGQATNSHSLAERVRREKISERMKFLQDLVPGCSKVTGKAVMLDEIINYVQSLQRQVEFLSMKLATVNPQLDFNIEGFLAKDILLSRPGLPPTVGFSADLPMAYPSLNPTLSGLTPPGVSGMIATSDVVHRTISSQMASMSGSKQSDQVSYPAKHQLKMPGTWEDEISDTPRIGYQTGASPISRDSAEAPTGPS